MHRLVVRKVAVLGSGVMGAQIAAHLTNADVPVILFDLAAKDGNKNGIVTKAIDGLKKLNPPPFSTKDRIKYVDAANYEEHLSLLTDCDLVIEAIAERLDWKNDLYAKIGAYLKSGAILASNTSGISINLLAQGLPESVRPYFCGIHFFNPPRYMYLVEIIPTRDTEAKILDALETWLTTKLGKGVIRALDTPNFVANRVGIFSLLAVMHHTAAFGLGCDEADELTGPRIGRSKSATYRTADIVGLDTLAHVVKTMCDALPDDPWHHHFHMPKWIEGLIEKGALGQKAKCGIFRKQGKDIQVFDPLAQDYRISAGKVADEVATILKITAPVEKFAALRASSHPQAQFLWAIFRDVFHYCAVQLEHIADNARDVDFALRWGFGWVQGPFETWQAADWRVIGQAIAEDIANGKAMSTTALPDWVTDGRLGVHFSEGSWSAGKKSYIPRSSLPVYQRQLFPERILGAGGLLPEDVGETLFENEGVRLWRLPDQDSGIGIISLKSKMHAIGSDVLAGVQTAISEAERNLDGLVIWHETPFAVGANLKEVMEALEKNQFDQLNRFISQFQQVTLALKYSQVPVVAAVLGMALGGGCEFAMHATKRVMALESNMGLVEAGVGLIPAGGGCKEFALQAATWAARSATPNEMLNYLQQAFLTIAMAKVSGSAHEAIALGLARPEDTVLFNGRELLAVAIKEARNLANAGYSPPLKARGIPVAGRTGIAMLEMMLVNMREGGMISAHDYKVARAAAVAICGGEIEAGSLVDEDWLLTIERRLFVELLKTPETQARIKHMLDTGKPLRN